MVRAWDSHCRLSILSLDEAAADCHLGGLAPERRFGAAHLVAADGRLFSGAPALARAAAELPAGRLLAGAYFGVPGVAAAAGAGYRLVARHRDRLAGLVPDRPVTRIER